MDAEHPVVQVERPVPVLLHPGDGFGGHAVLDVLAGDAFLEVGELPRRDVAARRSRSGMMRHIDIKALLQRRIRLRAQMPLAEVPGGITRLLQRLRQRAILRLQPRGRRGLDRLLIRRSGFPCRGLQHHLRQVAVRRGDARACRTEPRENGRTRGRAQRTGRIGASEGHATLRQPLDVRRLVKLRVPVQRRVGPAQVIGEDEDEVGLRFSGEG